MHYIFIGKIWLFFKLVELEFDRMFFTYTENNRIYHHRQKKEIANQEDEQIQTHTHILENDIIYKHLKQ